MNISEIEIQLRDLVKSRFDPHIFPFRLLEIYEAPRAAIAKLRQGSANQAKSTGDLLWKHKLFFRAAAAGAATSTVDAMAVNPLVKRHSPRFIMATDGSELVCRDVKADQTLDIDHGKLNDRFDFFLPLAGIERYEAVAENPADIKATGRLARLYDAILEANPAWTEVDHTHELNLFMTRMLFCFFAEDTSIFEKGLFTATIFSMTEQNGSNTASVLETLFLAMDTPPGDRAGLPDFARKFPYVNGGLFADRKPIPRFSARARRLLRECGDLSWQDINPDIFGSMIQAIVKLDMRGDMGMHYTSVPNIMKVLQPLFLLSLEGEFEAARDSEVMLRKLLVRLYKIRIFDPACGSGNFLIVAYRELRKLESRIFSRLKVIVTQWILPLTGIKLNHFYGIELADFAVETAKLSLWIAEYQMNEHFKAMFGSSEPALPLKESGNIIHGNAARLEWKNLCPNKSNAEIYIVGNPPYLGSTNQSKSQKEDMDWIFSGLTDNYKNLDYVSIWFLKGADYCGAMGAKCAFVATNSVCQGEQVGMLWPIILAKGIEIEFAHNSFRWKNNATLNAGVTCVIIGMRTISTLPKTLYSGEALRVVKNISPYLISMDDIIVNKTRYPLNQLPKMNYGNKPVDGGNLMLSPGEKESLVAKYPRCRAIRPSDLWLSRIHQRAGALVSVDRRPGIRKGLRDTAHRHTY